MKNYSRVYAVIDLDAIEKNMVAMRANLTEHTAMIGVVKTDGYGHGAVPVAHVIDPFVTGFAVATVDEAVNLRNHGINKPILVLGVVHESRYEDLLTYDICPPMFQLEKAKKLSALAVSMKKVAGIHLAVDTGMSRIGMVPGESSVTMAVEISKLPGIRMEGMFTHFAKADETDKAAAHKQLERYVEFAKLLEEKGVHIPVRHCSNSAGIIDIQKANMDAVRAGISIYGLYPSDEVEKQAVTLTPAMELKSAITYLKIIAPGTQVSYGGTFTAPCEMTIATIPVGYGDGYPRNLSGKGEVLIRGCRAPILGRICMDQLMVDVSHIPGVKEDDPVTLIGADGSQRITVEELANKGGGFHYEIICDIGKRVPRVYVQKGRVVGSKDYFDDRYDGFTYQ